MTNGKFALCLVGGLVGCAAVGIGLQSVLSHVMSEEVARWIGTFAAGALGGVLGPCLARSGNRRSEQRRREAEHARVARSRDGRGAR
jgi:hypothetical protein